MYNNHTHNTTYMDNNVIYTRTQALFYVRIHHLEELWEGWYVLWYLCKDKFG